MRDMPNLDLVRSLAVISVVLEHLLLALGITRIGPFEVAWVGVLGVMVFFVLTSLVLMWSLERKPHTLDFYIRRFFRIFPLAWLALFCVALFHAPTSGAGAHFFTYFPVTLKVLLGNMSLLPGSTQSMMGVMWSLPYEVGMYVLLPAVFFYVRGNFSQWPLLVLWALVVETTLRTPANGHNFGVAIGYFLPGVMAYIAFRRWEPRLPAALLPVWLGLLWAVFWYHANFHRCWFFCLAVAYSLPFFRQITASWLLTPSRLIARYSYGIYLSHPFALVIGLYLLHGRPVWMQTLGFCVPLVVLPVLAYHLLELPMIRLGSRLANRAETRFEQSEMAKLARPLAG